MTKRTLERVWSPQLRNRRTVDVYLPWSYPSGRRYPVVYMQDGQNLSDPSTAFSGTWDLDATLDRLSASGREAIVVGVHHAGERRLAEYSPFPDRRHGGGEADGYLEFLTATLKPRIDRIFRTRRGRDETAIVGSSMGGLVSLYAYFRFPSVFGRAGVMSPSIWFGQGAILDFVRQARTPRGRVYVDVGAQEGAGAVRDTRRLGRLLVRKRFARHRGRASRAASQLRYVEDPAGRHQEAAWARRLEGALAFLLE
jgi:predicted alpha/beta superfamily hydrolase